MKKSTNRTRSRPKKPAAPVSSTPPTVADVSAAPAPDAVTLPHPNLIPGEGWTRPAHTS